MVHVDRLNVRMTNTFFSPPPLYMVYTSVLLNNRRLPRATMCSWAHPGRGGGGPGGPDPPFWRTPKEGKKRCAHALIANVL